MKKILLIAVFTIISINYAFSVTLTEALIQTYKNNTELNAERENVKVSQKDLIISKADYLPSASITGSKSKEKTNKLTNQGGGDASITDVDPLIATIKLEHTLVDFGRDAEYKKKKIGINLAEAKLLKKEQDIFYKAIEAYSGLILANEKLTINQINLSLLERQVETDKVRLERGQITVSDLAQSESSLAGAQAQFIQAKNEIVTNKLNYENIIGKILNPKSLEKTSESIVSIPQSLNSAIDLSKQNNPDITIAKLELEQSEKDIEIAESDLKPTATLSLERSYSDNLNTTYDKKEKDVLKATVSWPFYSGGKKRVTISKNQNLKTRKRLLLDNAIKTNDTIVATAWANLQSSKSFLNFVRLQVRAAQIANEGITAEYERGSGRTTLDVIQSNTLLLNAKVSLSNSERNYLLAQYNLLKSVGLLNSNYLKLE
jgi:outer membrane protein